MSRKLGLFIVAAIIGTLFIAGPATATHSWNGYHWSRASNPFTVTLGNNLSSNWTPYLNTAASDWGITSGACNNPQNPIRCTVAGGGSGNGRKCRATAGRVEVCNGTYGNTGWLGIAQIWISGVHITQGTVRVNDTYFNTPQYNTPAWHSFVMDQEVGHEFGLAHQDEDFNNADLLDACGRGSCMDYSADPSNNTKPNQHDYDELVIIYSHSDGALAVANQTAASGKDLGQNPDEDMEDQSAWGSPVHFQNGRGDVYERDLGAGKKVLTHVLWVQ